MTYDLAKFRKAKAGVLILPGEQTRLGLAKAMLNRPRLLLLDGSPPPRSIHSGASGTSRAALSRNSSTPGALRRPVDLPQHVRGRGRLRPRALPFPPRPDPALEGDPKALLRPAQCGEPGRPLRRRGARGAARRGARGGRIGRRRHDRLARRRRVVALRQLYLYGGSPQRILPIFAWVAVDIVLWGFMTRYLNAVSHAKFNFVPALLGAVLLWDFLMGPRDAGREHGVPRGRVVAQFPQLSSPRPFAPRSIWPAS